MKMKNNFTNKALIKLLSLALCFSLLLEAAFSQSFVAYAKADVNTSSAEADASTTDEKTNTLDSDKKPDSEDNSSDGEKTDDVNNTNDSQSKSDIDGTEGSENTDNSSDSEGTPDTGSGTSDNSTSGDTSKSDGDNNSSDDKESSDKTNDKKNDTEAKEDNATDDKDSGDKTKEDETKQDDKKSDNKKPADSDKSSDGDKKKTYIEINEDNFPDKIFMAYTTENIDEDKDNKLSEKELEDIKELNLSHLEIENIKGIEYFTELTKLDLSYNHLTNIDIEKLTKLEYLDISFNNITNLDISKLTALNTFKNHANAKVLELGENNLIDLSVLDKFNLSNISECSQKYTVDENNNIILEAFDSRLITYTYSLENEGLEEAGADFHFIIMQPVEASEKASLSFDELNADESIKDILTAYDKDENNILDEAELNSITYMDLAEINYEDLSFIDYFPNLLFLNFNDEQSQTLDLEKSDKELVIYVNNEPLVRETDPADDIDNKEDMAPLTDTNTSDSTEPEAEPKLTDADDNTMDTNPAVIDDDASNDVEQYSASSEIFTITFDSAGGSLVPSQEVKYNKKVVEPQTPVREGYTFVEWQKEGKKYKFSRKVKESFTLTAVWSANTYKINYKLNGGKISDDKPTEYVSDTTVNLINPTRSKYNFGGWYLESNFKTKINKITNGFYKDLTLYAKWNKIAKPAKTKITSLKNKSKGKVTIKFNSVKNISGYEIICATDKRFKKNVRTTLTKKNSATVSGLIKGKKYYFKVRTYITDSAKEKVYGSYSSVKTVKVVKGISEANPTSTSASIKSCKVVNEADIKVTGKTSKIVKSKDSYYYLFALTSSQKSLSKLKPIAKAEKSTSFSFTAPLIDGSKNLLQSKFVIAIKKSNGKYMIISKAKYLSNPEGHAPYTFDFPVAESKKGLQDFSHTAGVNNMILNIRLDQIIASGKNGTPYKYKGKTYYFNEDLCNAYTESAAYYSHQGTVVSGILLVGYTPGKTNLIYPSARKKGFAYYAWNVKDKSSKEKLEAAITYLAEQSAIKCGDGPGIANWIVGNEVDNFDTWNYAGTSNLTKYTQIYADTVRLVYNATRSVYSKARVYVSLDHLWNMSNSGSFGSKAFLEKFNSLIKAEGNIDWHIAFHPYSVPLTETAFWKNNYISNNANTAVINMKNIKVLTDYVKKHYGSDTRIILSEIGYSATAGESVQAAAIAYAYYMTEFNPMIDSIIFRSLEDAPEEVAQGLAFGIKGRKAYDVFRYMDTPSSEKYTKFALKVIGAKSWKSIVPKFNSKKFKYMSNN